MNSCQNSDCHCRTDSMPMVIQLADSKPPTGDSLTFRIENMDCPTEEALIRSKLSKMPGIDHLKFDLIQRTLTVFHSSGNVDSIQAALISVGMKPALIDKVNSPSNSLQQSTSFITESRKKLLMLGIGGVVAAVSEIMAWTTGKESSWEVMLLSLIAIAVCGLGTYKKGWIALKNFNLNINALMSMAVTGAMLIGQWPEAAMVMVLFALAEEIESRSLDRARNAIHSLMALSPDKATVMQADASWNEVEIKNVAVGSLVRVKPGERIPLDGIVVSGRSSVNQAAITGESIAVTKNPGDPVYAGTINETGSFDYRTTVEADHSTLARIIKVVEEAQSNQAPTQRFVDRFSKIYTPAVLAIALSVAVIPPLVFSAPWVDWIYKALVLMVIACPCALVISTPVTVVSGLASAARAGILIKGGIYLEQGRQLKSIAFDKTGTITQGKPVVTDVVALSGHETDGLHLAASLAARSDHPVSSALSAYWNDQAQNKALAPASDFNATAGRGIKGRINNKWYFLGNHRLVEELGICNAEIEAVLDKLEEAGKTAVSLCDEFVVLTVIAIADPVRETSREAVANLHALGVHTVMLTGDNPHTAKVVAEKVGIDDARGNLLPEDKLSAIHEEMLRYGCVGMAGDGINDAPALAKASIGFAMGAAGTDTALETADVALMDDDLRKIPLFIRLSRRTAAVLQQNIAMALSIKILFFVLAISGNASLWMAVFADMGASLIVIFNGLRLLKPLPLLRKT